MFERYRGEDPLTIPNVFTAWRINGAIEEALDYRETGELNHFVRGGGYFAGDFVDGLLARFLKQCTQFGGDLDKVGDKFSAGLMMYAAYCHKTIDKPVLFAVAALDTSNMLATGVGMIRRTAPSEVANINRWAAAVTNMGFGLNVIGNHLRQSKDVRQKMGGHLLRITGASMAIGGAATIGRQASTQLWREVLRPKAKSKAFDNPPVSFPYPLRTPRRP